MMPKDRRNYDDEVDILGCQILGEICQSFGLTKIRNGVWEISNNLSRITLSLSADTPTSLIFFHSKPLSTTKNIITVDILRTDLADKDCQAKITNWVKKITEGETNENFDAA